MTYIIIQLIRVNYIVKPETQNIEKNTKTARNKFTVQSYYINPCLYIVNK